MRKIFLAVLIGACALVLSWYAWLFYISKDARKVDNANVFVTFHSTPMQCDIRIGVSGARHELACGDVAPYIRADLKLVTGATYVVWDLGNHSPEIATLNSALEA